MNLKIALDIDSTIAGFEISYNEYFKTDLSKEPDWLITKRVYKLRHNRDFWINLPVIDEIDFIPEIYATKRINPKSYTREWISKNGFPNRPIYQTVCQCGNKADIIKGRCNVLVDDSFSNVIKCINSGVPSLLIDRSHNRHINTPYRIFSLTLDEIINKYNKLW